MQPTGKGPFAHLGVLNLDTPKRAVFKMQKHCKNKGLANSIPLLCTPPLTRVVYETPYLVLVACDRPPFLLCGRYWVGWRHPRWFFGYVALVALFSKKAAGALSELRISTRPIQKSEKNSFRGLAISQV